MRLQILKLFIDAKLNVLRWENRISLSNLRQFFARQRPIGAHARYVIVNLAADFLTHFLSAFPFPSATLYQLELRNNDLDGCMQISENKVHFVLVTGSKREAYMERRKHYRIAIFLHREKYAIVCNGDINNKRY